jgi:phosphate:Na+ symporter
MLWQTLGGIGLFLLGMILMTDGLKALAGSALRAILARMVRGPASGIGWGATLTAMVQSSSATTMTTIGFVSAGLLSFPQAVGVIFGANLGTTSTGWIVALLGFKLSIGTVAQPLIFLGVILRLLGRDRAAALGTTIAGFGLLFVGLDVLQAGMAGLSSHIAPESFPPPTVLGSLALIGIGLAMTVVLQSSSAAIATTLAALHSGNITLDQAAALVIGQNIGTCVTAVIASLGASPAGKRTAVAHIGFNIVTGLLALPLLPFIVDVTDWATKDIEGGADTIALAAFHTIFNLVGVLVLYPLIGPFSRLVERIIPVREPSLSENLDPSIASVPAVAMDAVRTALSRTRTALAGAIALRLNDERRISPALCTEARLALDRAGDLLGLISTEPTVAKDWSSQNNLLHAIDHVASLIDAAESIPVPDLLRVDEATEALTQQLLDALTRVDDPDRLSQLSREVAQKRSFLRKSILERTATGAIAPNTAMRRIDAVQWADTVLFHLWRSGLHILSIGTQVPRESPDASP